MASSALELRGDGKAGGGLVLCFQSIADLLLRDEGLHVQEWPFFSSARRGANIRSYLRVSRKPITQACEIERPQVAVLMNEVAARSSDFALGVPPGGTFIVNSRHSPEECALHFKLSGHVVTVPGDDIGEKHLGHTIGNVSVYVAMAAALGTFTEEQIFDSFLHSLKKRRLPQVVIDKNLIALKASAESIRSGDFDVAAASDHSPASFQGYGELPVGAQSALRLSEGNRTSDYARSGMRLKFSDPEDKCTACAHCITNCPEGIIHFRPVEGKGPVVTGVDVSSFCKLCGECIAICPEGLFQELPFEEKWEEEAVL